MELATSTSATAVWGTATRPAAGSLRAVSAPQRPVRQLEAPKPPRRRTQYTLCQATAVARESPAVAASSAVEQQVQQLAELLEACQPELTYQDKASVFRQLPHVQQFLASRQGQSLSCWLSAAAPAEQYVCLCAVGMAQEHAFILPDEPASASAFSILAQRLLRVDQFYNSVGGLLGYQLLSLKTIVSNLAASSEEGRSEEGSDAPIYHMPRGLDLASPEQRGAAVKAVAMGLQALPHMAEIYPLGGAGDRLGLKCDLTGECVPAAVLPYCGRTLLEGLVRDVQAREYLYFRVFGQQHITPIAMMTSDAKDNHRRMSEVMRAFSWFGRGPSSFRVLRQPLVPVIGSQDGRWLVSQPGAPMLKPGGHGAIWKLMQDEGVFRWLADRDRQAAIVRQISNPLAGTDTTLLGLTGMGYADGRSFGFAACERAVGASEGINAVMQRRLPRAAGRGHEHSFNMTNVEYTEFDRLGIKDEGESETGISLFPANTNVLYIGLQAAEMAVRADTTGTGGAMLPGMIFNSSKRVAYTDALTGEQRNVPAGRLECTMQNLVDQMGQTFQQALPSERHSDLNTFVVFNQRRKVTSSAKRRRQPGSTTLAQTPDGSFRDLMQNAADLLQQCGFSHVPAVGDPGTFLQQGPGFVFLFHPALGPVWEVIAQKLRGGHLAPQSELVLEVAEAAITELRLDGSLLVQADNPVGCLEAAPHEPAPGVFEGAQAGEGRLVYSNRCGRVRLHNVSVHNRGLDWDHPGNVYWSHKVHRLEATRIILHGQSEFEASDVVLVGNHMFEVPDGYRMAVHSGVHGGLRRSLHPLPGRQPSWEWHYGLSSGQNIQLSLKEPAPQTAVMPVTLTPEMPFIYVI